MIQMEMVYVVVWFFGPCFHVGGFRSAGVGQAPSSVGSTDSIDMGRLSVEKFGRGGLLFFCRGSHLRLMYSVALSASWTPKFTW